VKRHIWRWSQSEEENGMVVEEKEQTPLSSFSIAMEWLLWE
jgi:hypothetical protein